MSYGKSYKPVKASIFTLFYMHCVVSHSSQDRLFCYIWFFTLLLMLRETHKCTGSSENVLTTCLTCLWVTSLPMAMYKWKKHYFSRTSVNKMYQPKGLINSSYFLNLRESMNSHRRVCLFPTLRPMYTHSSTVEARSLKPVYKTALHITSVF